MNHDATLTISEAAKYLHVSPNTLRRWDANGKLIAYRTPTNLRRYTRTQLEQAFTLPTQTEDQPE